MTITCGEKILLEAVIQGAPKPNLHWSTKTGKIHESRHVTILEEVMTLEGTEQVQTRSTLLLENAQELDSGKYTLRALNRVGVKSSSVNIIVKGDYDYNLSCVLAYLLAFSSLAQSPAILVN